MTPSETLLTRAYEAFNARDVEAVLAVLDPAVDWPNSWEGGRLSGREAVRDYWTRQWQAINPRAEPERFTTEPDGRVRVDVHQTVRDLAGEVVMEGPIQHVYTLANGLIVKMEIEESTG